MDILQQIQLDISSYLNALAATVNTPIFVVRPRDEAEAIQIQTDIDNALAGLTYKPDNEETGKNGLAIIILMTEGDLAKRLMESPLLDIKITVRVMEMPMINMGATGTEIPCEQMALTVLNALHGLDLGYGHKVRGQENDTLKPVTIPGKLCYDVNLECTHQEPGVTRVLPVTLSNAANTITLATPTSGAAIYYTDDGTFPDATNGELYAAPFVVTPPKTIRACAFKTGLSPSNVTEKTISA